MKKSFMIPLALVFLTIAAGMHFASEETQEVQKISAVNARILNFGCETMELNPLKNDEEGRFQTCIEEYYAEQREDSAFVENYDNIQIYTKKGKYNGSYVAFVKYEMKIKDIYTKVPGLGTFYVEKDYENGTYKIAEDRAEEVKDYVLLLTSHSDVQALFDGTNEEYKTAVQSDALLQEALWDLKNAYEDETGSQT